MARIQNYLGYHKTTPLPPKRAQKMANLLLRTAFRLCRWHDASLGWEDWLTQRQGWSRLLGPLPLMPWQRRRHRLFLTLRKRLIQANMRLVFKEVARLNPTRVSEEDLLHEGSLGLMRAVDKYNPEMGTKLSTYAVFWIRSALYQAQVNQGQTVRRPMNLVQDYRWLERHGQDNAHHLSESRQHRAQNLNGHSYSLGSEAMMAQLEQHPQGTIAFPAEQIDSKASVRLVNHLPLRQQLILKMRYGIGYRKEHSYREIADQFSLSAERVRQLELAALAQLRATDELEA